MTRTGNGDLLTWKPNLSFRRGICGNGY